MIPKSKRYTWITEKSHYDNKIVKIEFGLFMVQIYYIKICYWVQIGKLVFGDLCVTFHTIFRNRDNHYFIKYT